MTELLLFCDVLRSVDGSSLAASQHGALINDLCPDTGNTSPSEEGGVVGWVFESHMVKKRTAGDVNVGVGVGNFLVFRKNSRGDFPQGSDDFEILIVRAELFSEFKLNGCSRVFGPKDCVAKPEHGTLGCEFAPNEGLNLIGVAGSDAEYEFQARWLARP